MDNPGAVIH